MGACLGFLRFTTAVPMDPRSPGPPAVLQSLLSFVEMILGVGVGGGVVPRFIHTFSSVMRLKVSVTPFNTWYRQSAGRCGLP